MKIHHTTALGVCDTYEVVTEPPLGYIIWNIGDNAPEGYLPFCRLKFMQPFEGGREIESDTLKAMKRAGEDYTSFSGLADGKKGNVSFLYETEEIED